MGSDKELKGGSQIDFDYFSMFPENLKSPSKIETLPFSEQLFVYLSPISQEAVSFKVLAEFTPQ
jgi:hypothetical protein